MTTQPNNAIVQAELPYEFPCGVIGLRAHNEMTTEGPEGTWRCTRCHRMKHLRDNPNGVR